MDEIIAAGIAAGVSLVLSYLVTLKENSRFFSNTVSHERLAWIKEIRDLTVTLFSICERYEADELPEEQFSEFLKARNGILIRLNPSYSDYSLDRELHSLLSEPDFTTIKENVPRVRNIIGTILKSEWDKVKIEAGNSPSKIRRIQKLQNQIEKRKI